MKPALVIFTLLLLATCRSPDSVKKSEAEQDWFDHYYGTYKSEEKKVAEAICKFYDNCPKEKQGWW